MTNSEFGVMAWNTDETITSKIGELGSQSILDIRSPSGTNSVSMSFSPTPKMHQKKNPMSIKDRS